MLLLSIMSKNKKRISLKMRFVVGILGLEPRMTGPESVVLPLHHIPMLVLRCKVTTFFVFRKRFTIFFLLHFIRSIKQRRYAKGCVIIWAKP